MNKNNFKCFLCKKENIKEGFVWDWQIVCWECVKSADWLKDIMKDRVRRKKDDKKD